MPRNLLEGERLNGLALCAGAGGLELGLKLLLGEKYRTVGYVEREAHAAATLVSRMEDAAMDKAPVWDDLETFKGRPWRGIVDLISAGFPCQPATTAGCKKGIRDTRWLWPDVWRVIREVRPKVGFFLENVDGLISVNRGRAFEKILREVASCGRYDLAWGAFRASDVGAPHLRQRIFFLGLADAARTGLGDAQYGGCGASKAEGNGRLDGAPQRRCGGSRPKASKDLFPPEPEARAAWRKYLRRRPRAKPVVRRGDDGLASRVDRVRLAGNGVVPLVAAYAFVALAQDLGVRVGGY